jgi:hypothetical protein
MPSADGDRAPSTTIAINYIKSNEFRESACDGALGGPTPNGKLWVAFYTERFPLPRITRQKLRPADEPGAFMIDEKSPAEPVESREGIVRNVEFGLYMSLESAEQLHTWLGKQLQELKKQGSST